MHHLIEKLKSKLRVLVVGDVMLDRWFYGRSYRTTKEYGRETAIIDVEDIRASAGGAANVALQLRSLGAEVTCCGLVGHDPEAEQLAHLLDAADCSACLITESNRPTTSKTRLVENGTEQFIRFDYEKRQQLSTLSKQAFVQFLGSRSKGYYDVIVVSDYNKGMISNDTFRCLHGIAPIVVDPKGGQFGKYRGAQLIKLNAAECQLEQVEFAAKICSHLIITYGAEGLQTIDYAEDQDRRWTTRNFPAWPIEVADCIGCGDATMAGIAMAVASEYDLNDIGWIGNLSGAVAASHAGTNFSLTREKMDEIVNANPHHWR